MTWLTETEMRAQRDEVREKKCGVCLHRKRVGSVCGVTVWDCRLGLTWPKSGLCLSMDLDDGSDHERE